MESVGIRVRALPGDRQNNEHPGAKREKSSSRRNKQQAESATGGDSVWEETCPLRPGNTGREASTKPSSLVAVGLVEAARFWGGQLFVLSRTKLSHYRVRVVR